MIDITNLHIMIGDCIDDDGFEDTYCSASMLPSLSKDLKAAMTTSSSSEPEIGKKFFLRKPVNEKLNSKNWEILTSRHSVGEKSQQLCEIDWSWSFIHHLVQFLVRYQLADLVKGGSKVILADDTITVMVHHLESLLKKNFLSNFCGQKIIKKK